MKYRANLFVLLLAVGSSFGCNDTLRKRNEAQLHLLDELWALYIDHHRESFNRSRQRHSDGEFPAAWAEALHAQRMAGLLTEVAEKYKTLPGQSDLYEERSTEAAQMLAESESRVAALEQDLNTFLEAKKQAVVLSAVRHQRERSLQTAIEDLRKRGNAFYDAKNYVRAVQEWESVLALIESHDLSPAPEWIDELVAEVKGDIASASAHLEK